jgi:uncharacterized protein (DUF1697 family)
MARQIAFLRAINLASNRRVRMATREAPDGPGLWITVTKVLELADE